MPEYKIEAHSELPQPHLIVTQSRQQAVRYSAALASNSAYHRVTVTVAGQVYDGQDEIRRMP